QQRLVGQTDVPPIEATLNAARTALAKSDSLAQAGDLPNAYFAARNADTVPSYWRRETWTRTAPRAGGPGASPLAASFATLPEHLQFAASLASFAPGDTMLPAGDFEDLQTMLQAGWRNFERPQPAIQ